MSMGGMDQNIRLTFRTDTSTVQTARQDVKALHAETQDLKAGMGGAAEATEKAGLSFNNLTGVLKPLATGKLFGLIGQANNFADSLSGMGGAAGLAGLGMLVAIEAFKHWDDICNKFVATNPFPPLANDVQNVEKRLGDVNKRMDELREKQRGTNAELAEYNRLQAESVRLEKEKTEAEERKKVALMRDPTVVDEDARRAKEMQGAYGDPAARKALTQSIREHIDAEEAAKGGLNELEFARTRVKNARANRPEEGRAAKAALDALEKQRTTQAETVVAESLDKGKRIGIDPWSTPGLGGLGAVEDRVRLSDPGTMERSKKAEAKRKKAQTEEDNQPGADEVMDQFGKMGEDRDKEAETQRAAVKAQSDANKQAAAEHQEGIKDAMAVGRTAQVPEAMHGPTDQGRRARELVDRQHFDAATAQAQAQDESLATLQGNLILWQQLRQRSEVQSAKFAQLQQEQMRAMQQDQVQQQTIMSRGW